MDLIWKRMIGEHFYDISGYILNEIIPKLANLKTKKAFTSKWEIIKMWLILGSRFLYHFIYNIRRNKYWESR